MKNYMRIDTFLSGGDFLAANGSFLESREAVNNLILGIAGRYLTVDEGCVSPPLFLSIADNDSKRLACLMTPPQRLVLYSDGKDTAEALGALAGHLIGKNIEIPGVIGPAEVCGQFADLWSSKKGVARRLSMNERAYELKKVIDPDYASGHFMKAGEDDLDLLSEWTVSFSAEALGDDMGEDAARELISKKIKAGDAFIWNDGGPVTMACAARPTSNGIAVNLVYTPPGYRKKGYATSCVAKLSAELLGRGYKFCTLFTDLKNPVSNDIYQKIGYEAVCDFNQYDFHAV